MAVRSALCGARAKSLPAAPRAPRPLARGLALPAPGHATPPGRLHRLDVAGGDEPARSTALAGQGAGPGLYDDHRLRRARALVEPRRRSAPRDARQPRVEGRARRRSRQCPAGSRRSSPTSSSSRAPKRRRAARSAFLATARSGRLGRRLGRGRPRRRGSRRTAAGRRHVVCLAGTAPERRAELGRSAASRASRSRLHAPDQRAARGRRRRRALDGRSHCLEALTRGCPIVARRAARARGSARRGDGCSRTRGPRPLDGGARACAHDGAQSSLGRLRADDGGRDPRSRSHAPRRRSASRPPRPRNRDHARPRRRALRAPGDRATTRSSPRRWRFPRARSSPHRGTSSPSSSAAAAARPARVRADRAP